jgi:hypothetical protein
MRGAPHALDGTAGWAAAFFEDQNAAALQRTLTEGSDRSASVAIKLYPISGIAQVPAHLAAQLGRQAGHAMPDALQVRMSSLELQYPGSSNRGPFTGRADSLMSVARCAALAYLHGHVPYLGLVEAPGREEANLIDLIELVPDETLRETEVVVTATVDARRRTLHGKADDLLYPTWEQARAASVEMAERSEAPLDLVERMGDLLTDGADATSVAELLKRHQQ